MIPKAMEVIATTLDTSKVSMYSTQRFAVSPTQGFVKGRRHLQECVAIRLFAGQRDRLYDSGREIGGGEFRCTNGGKELGKSALGQTGV